MQISRSSARAKSWRWRNVCAAIAACVALLSSAQPAEPDVGRPIRLATYLWPGSFWIDVAWQKGWFDEAGLTVERINVHRKYFESLDSLASGQLDVLGYSQFDLVRRVTAGQDLVGVAALDFSTGAEGLVAKTGIRQFSDLKGKRIALQRGTYMEYILAIAAERNGLNLNDVILVDRPQDKAFEDFVAGRVDAVMVWEPYVTQVLAAGGVSLFSSADFPGMTYTVLALRREFVNARPKDVVALLRVWHRGEEFVRDNPDESCAIVAQLYDVPLPQVHNLMNRVRVLDLADNQRAFSYAAGFESLHGSWRRINDFMVDRGLASRSVASSEHLNSRFIGLLE
jgi:NitT/TauT family transport system substrate-binding protein